MRAISEKSGVLETALFTPLVEPLNEIELRFRQVIDSENFPVKNMIDYLFTKGGKRLRPALVLISSLAWESPLYPKMIDIALSVELIHIATLIHDDVIDQSDIRRGVETYHKKWGTQPSVLFGDFLFSQAFVLLAKQGNLKIIENLSQTTAEICEGEIMQNFFKDDADISIEKYLKIVQFKTASLIAESCRVGAVMSGLGQELENQLYQFGLNLGMAFQIYDDYLDLIGTREKLGKPVFNDISNGYITLPVIHLLSNISNGNRQEVFDEISKTKGDEGLKNLKYHLEENQSLQYTLDCAKNYIYKAENEIKKIKQSKIKEYLLQVAQYIVQREF